MKKRKDEKGRERRRERRKDAVSQFVIIP